MLADAAGQMVVEPEITPPAVVGVPKKLTLSNRQDPVADATEAGVEL